MNNEIAVLAQFLESLGPEVSGRSGESAPLTDEQREKIRQFAAGNLSAEQRDAILPSILESDSALSVLVEALRSR